MTEKLTYIYILFLPLMNIPKFAFMGNKLQYADLIYIPLFLTFICNLVKKKFKFAIKKYDIPLLIFIILSFFSFIHSISPKDSLLDFLGLIYLISLYFFFKNIFKKKDIFKNVIFLIYLITLFISFAGILFLTLYKLFGIKWLSSFLFLGTEKSGLISRVRISSFLNLPEMFTNFALLGLGCSFVYRESLHGWKRRLINFSIIIIIFSVFLAFSRSLSGVMLLLAMITYHFKKQGILYQVLCSICLNVLIIIVLLAIINSVFMVYPMFLTKDKVTGIVNFGFNLNPDIRVYLTKAAVAISRRHPFFGIGIGSFTAHFNEFLSDNQKKELFNMYKIQPSALKTDPHSLYFGTAAEIGLLGFAALFLFFLFIIIKLIRVFKFQNKDIFLKDCSYIFLAAICGYLINGFFVDILSMRSLWILLALGMSSINLS